MSIFDSLETALKDKDWNVVKELYKVVSGKDYQELEEVEIELEVKETFEKIKKKKGRPKKVIVTDVEEVPTPQNRTLDISKFKMVKGPTPTNGEGEKNYGRILPFEPVANKWKDDRKTERDSASFDKLVRNKENSVPLERREGIHYIKVDCDTCGEKFDILEGDLKINADDGSSYFRCDGCWVKKKRRMQ